jgi:hypothetical protein
MGMPVNVEPNSEYDLAAERILNINISVINVTNANANATNLFLCCTARVCFPTHCIRSTTTTMSRFTDTGQMLQCDEYIPEMAAAINNNNNNNYTNNTTTTITTSANSGVDECREMKKVIVETTTGFVVQRGLSGMIIKSPSTSDGFGSPQAEVIVRKSSAWNVSAVDDHAEFINSVLKTEQLRLRRILYRLPMSIRRNAATSVDEVRAAVVYETVNLEYDQVPRIVTVDRNVQIIVVVVLAILILICTMLMIKKC